MAHRNTEGSSWKSNVRQTARSSRPCRRSLALSPAVSKLGNYALLPADSHEPLRQRMVLLKKAGETAKEFYAFVQQPEARAMFRRYGFVLPTEQ